MLAPTYFIPAVEELGDTKNCVNWPALSPLSDHTQEDNDGDDAESGSVIAWRGSICSSSSSWSSASASGARTDYNYSSESSESTVSLLVAPAHSYSRSAVPVFSGKPFAWNDGIDATLDHIPAIDADMDAEIDGDGLFDGL